MTSHEEQLKNLNLANSVFPGFNDKNGLMLCGYEWGHSKADQEAEENGEATAKEENVLHTFANKALAYGKAANHWPYDNNIKKWFRLWGFPLNSYGLGGAFEQSMIQTNWAATQGHSMGGSAAIRKMLLEEEHRKNFLHHVEALRPKLVLFFGRELINCLGSDAVLPEFTRRFAGEPKTESWKALKRKKINGIPFKGRAFKVFFWEFDNCQIVCFPHPSGTRGLRDEYIESFRPEMERILNTYKAMRGF